MSQGQMVTRLGVQDLIHYTNISKYELDKNEPPLTILLEASPQNTNEDLGYGCL
jgi:hypothetical protein